MLVRYNPAPQRHRVRDFYHQILYIRGFTKFCVFRVHICAVIYRPWPLFTKHCILCTGALYFLQQFRKNHRLIQNGGVLPSPAVCEMFDFDCSIFGVFLQIKVRPSISCIETGQLENCKTLSQSLRCSQSCCDRTPPRHTFEHSLAISGHAFHRVSPCFGQFKPKINKIHCENNG